MGVAWYGCGVICMVILYGCELRCVWLARDFGLIGVLLGV